MVVYVYVYVYIYIYIYIKLVAAWWPWENVGPKAKPVENHWRRCWWWDNSIMSHDRKRVLSAEVRYDGVSQQTDKIWSSRAFR